MGYPIFGQTFDLGVVPVIFVGLLPPWTEYIPSGYLLHSLGIDGPFIEVYLLVAWLFSMAMLNNQMVYIDIYVLYIYMYYIYIYMYYIYMYYVLYICIIYISYIYNTYISDIQIYLPYVLVNEEF